MKLPEVGERFDAYTLPIIDKDRGTIQKPHKHRDGPFTRIKTPPPTRKGSVGQSKRYVICGEDQAGNELCFYYYHSKINWCFTFETILE